MGRRLDAPPARAIMKRVTRDRANTGVAAADAIGIGSNHHNRRPTTAAGSSSWAESRVTFKTSQSSLTESARRAGL